MVGVQISGMHHSGTSAVAGLLASSGWNPGKPLVPDDRRTGKKFFEDSRLVSLNSEWLRFLAPSDTQPDDWGILSERPGSIEFPAEFLRSAQRFCDQRSAESEDWIAKDPRTSMTLPVWTRVEGLKYLFIYRNPWDVVASLMKFGEPFSGRAEWVRTAWFTYNSEILRFAGTLGSDCMLVSSSKVIENPSLFVRLFNEWCGKPSPSKFPQYGIDPSRFLNRPGGSSISQTFGVMFPEIHELLSELDALATLPREKRSPVSRITQPGGSNRRSKENGVQVIIPCKDDGQYLDETIASVEDSSRNFGYPVELTIVDSNSSEPSTLDCLQRLSAAGYQVIRMRRSGLPQARNRGLRKSRLSAVIPLDADNRLRPTFFDHAETIFNGDADVIFGPWQEFGLSDRLIEPPREVNWPALIPGNTIDSCVLIARKTLRKLGGWRGKFRSLEDWDLWIRALISGARFHRVEHITFEYFVRPGSMTWMLRNHESREHAAIYAVVKSHLKTLQKLPIDLSDWASLLEQKPPTASRANSFQKN